RRRHTRSDRDWSSDVCSSDLGYSKLLAPYAIPPANAGVDTDDDDPSSGDPWSVRVGRICDAALHDFIDIMVFLILGAVLASGVQIGRASCRERVWISVVAVAC